MTPRRLLRRVLPLLIATAILGGCARAAEPSPAPDIFVDELADMVFGDNRIVDLAIGYPIAQTSIIDAIDQTGASGRLDLDAAAYFETLGPLDAAYTRFTFDLRPHSVNVGQVPPGPIAERLRLAYDARFAVVQADPPGGIPARNASALAILSYLSPAEAQVRAAAARLHGRRQPARVQVRPGCDLFHAAEPSSGYVDSLVLAVADPGGTLDPRDENVFRCIFAAHLFNIGFADAVRTGRYASFPIDRGPTCGGTPDQGRAVNPRDPCLPLIRRRAHFAVAAELVRSGQLRPGPTEREAFRRQARAAVERIGWPVIVASNEYEALRARQLHEEPGPNPVSQ